MENKIKRFIIYPEAKKIISTIILTLNRFSKKKITDRRARVIIVPLFEELGADEVSSGNDSKKVLLVGALPIKKEFITSNIMKEKVYFILYKNGKVVLEQKVGISSSGVETGLLEYRKALNILLEKYR